MQTAFIFRGEGSDQGTPGYMVLDGLVLPSLELPWRNNATGRSRIPAGRFRCRCVRSPRFGDVFEVTGVPGRTAILIHSGNYAGDIAKQWDSQVQGCIELGERHGVMVNTQGRPQYAVLSSKPAIRRFMAAVAGDSFDLEIHEVSS